MSGFCLVLSAGNIDERIAAMLKESCAPGEKTKIIAPSPEYRIAFFWHPRRALAASHHEAEGITVVFSGEFVDEEGAISKPARRVFELYRADGLAEVARLNGSFAAIVVDPRRKTAVLLSDRLGTRPVYFWQSGSSMAAATRLSGLLANDAVPRNLRAETMVELLSFFRAFADHTQYADIHALQGAERVTLRRDRLERAQSKRLRWSPSEDSEDDAAARLAGAMRAAVRRRMKGKRSAALLLSGGLDSRMILAAATAEKLSLQCITTGAQRGMEVETAALCAEAAGQSHRYVEIPPLSLSGSFDAATVNVDGLYIAPINFHARFPEIVADHEVIFSGHGLDYLLRGMYLPRPLLRIAGSRTVLPKLRRVPDGAAATLARTQYVAADIAALRLLVPPARREDFKQAQISAIEAALARADIEGPHDAWDAYILHNQVRHYANSDFVAMDRFAPHSPVAFDTDVLKVYFTMAPARRAAARVAHKTMVALCPALMDIKNANTNLPARWSLAAQTGWVIARGALRRLALARRQAVNDPLATSGSWANARELLRRDPALIERLDRLPRSEALLDTGLLERDGIAGLVEEHRAGGANHSKMLLMLLTLDSWFGRFGYSRSASGVAE